MDLSNLKPAKGAKQPSAAGRARATARPPAAATRARSRARAIRYKRGFEGGQMPLHRRLPKRGFNNIFRTEYAVVNLDQLEARFDAGATVTPDTLRERGARHGRHGRIKVLARGEVTKALTVQAHKFSGKAAEKLAGGGGKAEAIAGKRDDRGDARG